MKAEDLCVAKPADHLSSVRAAKRVGSVVQQLKVVALCDLGQCFDGAGTPPDVHTDDARRARRDHLFHVAGIKVVCRRVHVAKDRGDFLPLQGVCRGDKGHRWHDDLASESGCPDRYLQRHRRVAHGDAMLDPE